MGQDEEDDDQEDGGWTGTLSDLLWLGNDQSLCLYAVWRYKVLSISMNSVSIHVYMQCIKCRRIPACELLISNQTLHCPEVMVYKM